MVKTTNQYLVCVVSSSLFENVGLTCIPHVLQIHVCRVFFCLRVFKASLFLFDVHFVVRRTLAKSHLSISHLSHLCISTFPTIVERLDWPYCTLALTITYH